MELNPRDVVVVFGPTQARAMIGIGDIQHVFSMNPDEVKWSYKNNSVSRDTIGGRVVQILSATVEAMSISGRAGSRRELQIMSSNLKKIMQYQIKTGEPVNFKVPSRNWDFLVYIQNVSGLGWDVTTTSYPYQLSLTIQDDLTGISQKVVNQEIFDSLTKGIGYNPEYHGGNTGEATKYIEAMQNALSGISTITDPLPSPLGDDGIGLAAPGEVSVYCKRFLQDVLVRDWSDLNNMGSYVCKKTLGTDTWSDHSWGAAIDWGNGRPERMQHLFEFCWKNQKQYNISYVIYNKQIWSRSNPTVHAYTGENPHKDHVHISFTDTGTGTPPCAKTQ